jgi:hypothetical protein
MPSTQLPDPNDGVWDPASDSATQRRVLLGMLDQHPACHTMDLFNPAKRTIAGRGLGHRATELLLGCSLDDLETTVNEINAAVGHDDDVEHAELEVSLRSYEALLGNHRVLKKDSDERTISGMPDPERRLARRLQLRIEEMRRHRYDPPSVARRILEDGIGQVRNAIRQADEEGDVCGVDRLQTVLERTERRRWELTEDA